jgi:hypothetical protein
MERQKAEKSHILWNILPKPVILFCIKRMFAFFDAINSKMANERSWI